MRAIGPHPGRILHRVHGDEVHHGVFPLEKLCQAVDFLEGVVDAMHQCPFVLNGIPRRPRPAFSPLDDAGYGHAGAPWKELPALFVVRRMKRHRERGPDRRGEELVKESFVAHGRNHEILLSEVAILCEELHSAHYVSEVVRGFSHAHEDHLLRFRPELPGNGGFGDDFNVGELPHESASPRHAEDAADGAPHLRRDADALPGKEHRFNRLAVGERKEKPFALRVRARVTRADGGDISQSPADPGKGFRNRFGEPEPAAFSGFLPFDFPHPGAAHPALMRGAGPERREALMEVFERMESLKRIGRWSLIGHE